MTRLVDDGAIQSLLADALVGIIEAANARRVFRIDIELAELIRAHPDCLVETGDLREYLMNFAADIQVPIEAGRSSGPSAPYADQLMREFHRMSNMSRTRPSGQAAAEEIEDDLPVTH